MHKFTFESVPIDGMYFTRLRVDDTPIGIVQSLKITQGVNNPFALIEVEQIIYSRDQLPLIEKMKAIQGMKYTPVFYHKDGSGPGAQGPEDAWFMEDQPPGSIMPYVPAKQE